MALKQWNQTKWNGKKQHEDGFNTDRDMAYSSKRKKTLCDIQRTDIPVYIPSPKRARPIKVSGKLLTYPSPKPTFCPKWEVSVDVGLGEG